MIYSFCIALLELINEYSVLAGVREVKTSSSEIEAMYSFLFWQRRREVIVDLEVLCEMKSTRF